MFIIIPDQDRWARTPRTSHRHVLLYDALIVVLENYLLNSEQNSPAGGCHLRLCVLLVVMVTSEDDPPQ